jgi:hypothetical protein
MIKNLKSFLKAQKSVIENRLIDGGNKIEAAKKLKESLEETVALLLENPSRRLENQSEDSLEDYLKELENEREFPY